MINLKEVTFFYEKERPIFEGFSLSIKRGESLAVLGPSGCGKTTLLYLIGGLLSPHKGEVWIDKEMVRGPREKTSLILQDYGLLPWKTIKENIELGLRFRKIKGDSLPEYWLRRLNIYEIKDKYPHQVSGGQKQRAAIARSLILKPDIVLMDEPFSSLDAPTRENLQDLILSLRKDEVLTVVLVTHTIEEAAYVGDRILVLLSPPHKTPFIIENTQRGSLRRDENSFHFLCTKLRNHIAALWNQGPSI